MKIFIIARGYPSHTSPTWGCFEKDQAEALVQMGHQVTILSVDTRFRFDKRKLGIQHLVDNGISIYNMFVIPSKLLFFIPQAVKNKFYAWLLLLTFRKAIKTHEIPDVIYAHYLDIINWAMVIKKRYNIPLVGMEHWSKINQDPMQERIRNLIYSTYPHVDHLIAVSEALKQTIMAMDVQPNISVIHNMVSDDFHYIAQENHPLTFISVGRLVSGKRFDLLIDALSNTKKILPKNWRLLIVGDGKLKKALQQQITNHKLEKHIYLLGQKTKAEIVHLLQTSDIFVLPSQSETFGVAYIEALACGLPIIATDCGGPRDIVTPNNGFLIPTDNQQALEKAIINMVQNMHLYNRQMIADECQNRFSSTNVAKRILKILENTIQESKKQK